MCCQSCKAKIESDTKKLLRAEEADLPTSELCTFADLGSFQELTVLKSERQAQGRVGLCGNTITPLLLLLLLLSAKEVETVLCRMSMHTRDAGLSDGSASMA